jgi:hypothetical protein
MDQLVRLGRVHQRLTYHKQFLVFCDYDAIIQSNTMLDFDFIMTACFDDICNSLKCYKAGFGNISDWPVGNHVGWFYCNGKKCLDDYNYE